MQILKCIVPDRNATIQQEGKSQNDERRKEAEEHDRGWPLQCGGSPPSDDLPADITGLSRCPPMTRSRIHMDPLWLRAPVARSLVGIPSADRCSLDARSRWTSRPAGSPGSYLMILELKAACNSHSCGCLRYHGSLGLHHYQSRHWTGLQTRRLGVERTS